MFETYQNLPPINIMFSQYFKRLTVLLAIVIRWSQYWQSISLCWHSSCKCFSNSSLLTNSLHALFLHFTILNLHSFLCFWNENIPIETMAFSKQQQMVEEQKCWHNLTSKKPCSVPLHLHREGHLISSARTFLFAASSEKIPFTSSSHNGHFLKS
jgi:hypothetical protein